MKRLLLSLIVAIVPTALLADVADRDVLLTPGGTLYTVESVSNDGSPSIDAARYLNLTIQRGTQRPQTMVVPGSVTPGVHWRPALAYDTDSNALFVFWLKMPNGMSSELVLASYSNGRWQPAVLVDDQSYRLRFNLRIAITRRVAQLQKDGTYTDIPALIVHAVWWEQSGYDEVARYALISIDKGTPSTPELHALSEFTASLPLFPNEVPATFNNEILKHPAFVDNGTQNSVDVIFGDSYLNAFNRVTLKPVADVRIHIPIGARPVGPRVAAPTSFSDDWSGRITTIPSPHDASSFLLYNTGKDAVNYLMYSGGAWSSVKTLPLSEKFSADAAVAALTKMMSQ